MSETLMADKTKKPDEKQLTGLLGASFRFWKEIASHVEDTYENISNEWKFYGQKYGWQLKTLMKKRNLFFMIPSKDFFRIVFIFGDKAAAEIEKSGISAELINQVKNARKYAEGRGLPIEVYDGNYIPDIKKLIEIKIKN